MEHINIKIINQVHQPSTQFPSTTPQNIKQYIVARDVFRGPARPDKCRRAGPGRAKIRNNFGTMKLVLLIFLFKAFQIVKCNS